MTFLWFDSPLLAFESQFLLYLTVFFLTFVLQHIFGGKDDENPVRVVVGTVPPVLCLCLRHLQDGADLQKADLQDLLPGRY